jgi:methionine-rich copper-binding protein CopC
MNRRHALVVVVVALLALCAGRDATVSAHAELTSSSPADGAVLEALPGEVELVFSENVGTPAALTVLGPDGSDLGGGDVAVVGATLSRTVAAGTGAAGAYTISYQVTSADGHPISGSIGFAIGGSGAAAPAAPTGSAADPTDASPAVVAGLAAAAAVALGIAFVATRRMIVGGDAETPT